jgi:DNA-binding MarR family transcriptional regulator
MTHASHDPERSFAALVTDIARLLRRNFNRRVRDFGMTQTQWQAIAYLRRWGGINQAALAELMEIQPISLARLVDRLEAAGWVERQPDPADRRAVKLRLTDKAAPILEEMRSASTAFHDEALAGLSTTERERVLGVLSRVKGNLLAVETCATTAAKPHPPAKSAPAKQLSAKKP